jgi:hypothetical protein
VKALLPDVFQTDYIILIHILRSDFKNREAEIYWVAVPKQAVSAVARASVVSPSGEQVIIAVC